MEKRQSKKKVDTVKPVDQKPSSQITFDSFFLECVRKGTLKEWQRREIATFFRELGLREKEDLEVFAESLKKY